MNNASIQAELLLSERSVIEISYNPAMRDYWLSKLFFDLQNPAAAAEYRADRDKVLARYPLKPALREAIAADDVAAMAPLVNAYLLRFYFLVAGMSEAEFLRRIRGSAKADHG